MGEVIFKKSDTHYYIGERLFDASISTTPILTENDVRGLVDANRHIKMLRAKLWKSALKRRRRYF